MQARSLYGTDSHNCTEDPISHSQTENEVPARMPLSQILLLQIKTIWDSYKVVYFACAGLSIDNFHKEDITVLQRAVHVHATMFKAMAHIGNIDANDCDRA